MELFYFIELISEKKKKGTSEEMNNRLSDTEEWKNDPDDRIKWKLLNQNSKKQSKF